LRSITRNIWTMRFLLRVLVSAAALGVATWVVSGITLPAASGWSKAGTLLVVALVVNGLLLWLTSWVAGKLSLPFHISGFWAAFWGAIIVGLVSWVLNLFIRDKRTHDDEPPPVRVVRVS